jgi:hypothetical protein
MRHSIPALAHVLADTRSSLHRLHDPERAWPQTNCAVDLMIELVAAHGFEPLWMLAFTLTQDFEGDHCTFFKVPSDDLEALYGLAVLELAVWDDLMGHITEQLDRGRVVLVEVDGYHLPDTRGVTYREHHGKTTIGIHALDPESRRMAYFHNETHGVLEGDDFDGVLQRQSSAGVTLLPYTEFLKPVGHPAADPVAQALRQLRRHWARRPGHNPFAAHAQAFPRHAQTLAARGPAYFHTYAFNTLRQAGANFDLMADFLAALPDADLQAGAPLARSLADDAKAAQFRLARAVARQRFDGMTEALLAMAATHDRLMQTLGRSAVLAP